MGWGDIIKLSAASQVRIFGDHINIYFESREPLMTKGIITKKMVTQKESYSVIEAHSIMVSILIEEIEDYEDVKYIEISNKKHGIMKTDIEGDGFYSFYLKD